MIFTPFSLVVLFLMVGAAARASKGAPAVLLTLIILLGAINVLPIYRTHALSHKGQRKARVSSLLRHLLRAIENNGRLVAQEDLADPVPRILPLLFGLTARRSKGGISESPAQPQSGAGMLSARAQ